MLRYAITDGALGGLANSLSQGYASRTPDARMQSQRRRLLGHVRRLAFEGIEFVQLREKNLPAGELAEVAREVLAAVREANTGVRVLVNTRVDVAIAVDAHGIHLAGMPGELTPGQVRRLFEGAGREKPVVSKACHRLVEVHEASRAGADLILFSPVFGKWIKGTEVVRGVGLERLRRACEAANGTPVVALGGVTEANASECREAGAAGVAGIRLFGW